MLSQLKNNSSNITLYEYQVEPGPNEVVNSLDQISNLVQIPRIATLRQDLKSLTETLSGQATGFTIQREPVPTGSSSAPLARHAAENHSTLRFEHRIRELTRPSEEKRSEELAEAYKLVTPLTSALVLEFDNRCDRGVETQSTARKPSNQLVTSGFAGVIPARPEPPLSLIMLCALAIWVFTMFDQKEKANHIADDVKRIAALLAAFSPVCLWYAARTCDKSDEPWGLVALISLIGVLALGAKSESGHGGTVRKETKSLANSIIGVVILVAYLATFSIAPHLVQAVLFALTLWYVAISRMALPSKTGALGLLLLSLPVIPSLNFFAGYPLRLLVANGANIMLNILGIGADVNGVVLTVDGKFQAIDAPCSGISMFWVEFYVVMMLACVFKLNAKNTGILTVIALPLIVLGNILRVTSIISFSKITSLPSGANLAHFEPSVHLGSGLVVFCLVCLATIKVASILARPSEFAKVTCGK